MVYRTPLFLWRILFADGFADLSLRCFGIGLLSVVCRGNLNFANGFSLLGLFYFFGFGSVVFGANCGGNVIDIRDFIRITTGCISIFVLLFNGLSSGHRLAFLLRSSLSSARFSLSGHGRSLSFHMTPRLTLLRECFDDDA